MRYSLKTKFWCWACRWSKRLYFYLEKKSNQTLTQDYSKYVGTSSNCYPFERVWEDDDNAIYTFQDRQLL